ncbi:NAD(P)H-dependent oxidoreductase subunit E [Candidatus Sumerlaeota bacterium]|nr:NAD(P)H-dependent oxidoreductase subunit E [Candidatus Sumerlaeota bacterium]
MLVTEQDALRNDIVKWAAEGGNRRDCLIPLLQRLQQRHREITDFAMQVIADALEIHPVEVYGVVSFYQFLDEKPKGHFVVRLCRTISCDMQGKDRVARQLETDLGIRFGETTPDGKFTLEWAHCTGMCDQGPAMLINDTVFTHATPELVHDILQLCRKSFGSFHLQGTAEPTGIRSHSFVNDLTFRAVKSGAGLRAALKMTRGDVLKEVADSGLKGRGGAGFPTGVKWNLAAAASAPDKCIVCNADEGEPGTFKDRVILNRYPELVFEGMAIAGLAIGASHGILYLRQEYSYLRERLEGVLRGLREAKELGRDVLGQSGFNFDIEIRTGAGAYVCGEETALIESLEGQRGEPRNRPPYPVNTGYNGRPTVVNNVETLAWVPCILDKGGNWFSALGTDRSRGLKLFSVSGDCEKPGVYEFPWGITVAELMKEVGGENAKAVQVGGASGHIVPASEFARTVAFEDMPTGGSIIVFGAQRDMLSVTRNFLEFFCDESCGQCTPCREGNVKLLEGVKMLEEGRCSTAYLKELCKLGESMQVASKCGLGQSSPNAFLSMVKHFPDEIMGRTELII